METTTTNGNRWRLRLEAWATANKAHYHITSSLKLEPQPPEHICLEISLPRLDMLPDSTAPQPQASLLLQPQGTLNFSLFFSLTYTGYWVFGLMGFSQSRSLSLYLKNESEMWNEMTLSLSLFKTLSLSLWTVIQWLVDCFCLPYFITLLIFVCPYYFIRWCWCWCWWDTINCLLVYCDLWL